MPDTPGQNPSAPAAPAAVPAPGFDPAALRALVGESVKALIPQIVEALRPPPPPEEKTTVESLKQAVDALRREKAERDEQLERERARAALQNELAAVPWFDMGLAAEQIFPRVKKDDQGYHVIETETVAGTQVPVRRSLAEAAQILAKARPYLVRAEMRAGASAQGGNGNGNGTGRAASGSGGVEEFRGLNYDQAMARSTSDKAGFLKFIREYPDDWQRKKAEAAEARAAAAGARR